MATKNLVPRATGEGSLGTAAKKWGNIYADNITLQDGETLATKISSQNSRITTAEGTVTSMEGTVTTLSGDVTSLYSSVDDLSSGKVDVSTYNIGMAGKVDKSINDALVVLTRSSVGKGSLPSVSEFKEIGFADNTTNIDNWSSENSKRLAKITMKLDDQGETGVYLQAYDIDNDSNSNAVLGIFYPKGSTPYALAPTPAITDNSTKIATTSYVKNQLNTHFKRVSGDVKSATFTFERASGYRADHYLLLASNGVWELYVNTGNPAIERVQGSATATISASKSGSKMTITVTVSSTSYGGMLLIGDIPNDDIVI